MSIRRKIFISYLAIFLVLTILLYPLVSGLTKRIQENNLQQQTQALVATVVDASTTEELLERLQNRHKFLFSRVTLISPENIGLYDSHEGKTGIPLGEDLPEEIKEAVSTGIGSEVRYSERFEQDMAYTAVAFQFQGNRYILTTATPYGQIARLTRDLTLTFLGLTVGILLIFSFLAWFIIHYLTRPVQQIIDAITPYQLGQADRIPEIILSKEIQEGDDFGRLASTLNSLSRKIEHQIATLTQEKNEKSTILESLVEGVIAVDEELNIVYMNQMAEKFLEVGENELVGHPFSKVNQPQCLDLLKLAQQQPTPVVAVIQPERKPRRVFDAVAVSTGRAEEGIILVLQDTTSLHKVVEQGRDFVANSSHELKTPITIIRGFAETLHDHPELSQEVSLEITQKIVNNCQRMDTLIKNLLTLAAIDEGLPRSRMQECDLEDLAEQAKQTVLAVHETAEITIQCEGTPPYSLLADSDLLFQAILNLIDNGAKYSKAPAQITVTIIKHREEFEMQISDKGIGIPPEDTDRIFERFYSVDKSHSRSMGGSGLGLSIVERIIEKHQGRIDCASTLGKGTTFTITLPIPKE